jgi:hypothetical protein
VFFLWSLYGTVREISKIADIMYGLSYSEVKVVNFFKFYFKGSPYVGTCNRFMSEYYLYFLLHFSYVKYITCRLT